jgi:Telomere resolvase
MPSKKPRLWLYVETELKSALAEYAQEAGFSNEQAVAVAILNHWHKERRSGEQGALSDIRNSDGRGREHSRGDGSVQQGVTENALREHSRTDSTDWGQEIDLLRSQTSEQVAELKADVTAMHLSLSGIAERLDTLLSIRAVRPDLTEAVDTQPQEIGEGDLEVERVDPGKGSDTQSVEQGVILEPSNPPVRRRGRPGRSASLEARGDLIFDGLVRTLSLKQTERDTAVHALAKAERTYQEGAYRISDGSAPNWNTILKTNVSLIKERVRGRCPNYAVDHPEMAETISQLTERFCLLYSELLKDETERHNRNYQAAVALRATEPVAIDLTDLLKTANSTLQNINAGLPTRWEDVSVALALATGRRMAEIHASADFEPASNYSVLFSGQLKTREGTEAARAWAEQPKREVPTLLSADLVLAGWNWLEKNGHRVASSDDVNPRFAQRLSKFLLGLKINPKLSYKNLRDLYVSACYRNALDDGHAPESLQSIGQIVLGHGPLSGGATASYMKFTLAPSSLSRI